ncbi:hypothetical protein OMCYN_00331 [cyanobiont of Ornithocercus magnificus]|nr:hypothetical protein OMCYN_00331 [cyanobiont of Ornithocercus magnificus]
MLTTSTRLRLQDILKRIASSQSVSLSERIYLQKFVDHDSTVAAWLRRARRQQQQQQHRDGVDQLLGKLDLGIADPDERFHPDDDDLGDWFRGAPSWLRRS